MGARRGDGSRWGAYLPAFSLSHKLTLISIQLYYKHVVALTKEAMIVALGVRAGAQRERLMPPTAWAGVQVAGGEDEGWTAERCGLTPFTVYSGRCVLPH